MRNNPPGKRFRHLNFNREDELMYAAVIVYKINSTSLSSSLRESLVSLLGDQKRFCKIKKMKLYSYKSLISGSNRNYQLSLS